MENGHKFEMEYLKSLADFMKENDLDEVKVSEGDSSIRLSKSSKVAAAPAPILAPAVAPTAAAAPTAPAPEEPQITGHVVKSPMVGTFYRAPSPEADNFINVGDSVKKGQVICIIEAMKTMNQIEADKDGVVKNVMIENAQPVEFGEALFVIE